LCCSSLAFCGSRNGPTPAPSSITPAPPPRIGWPVMRVFGARLCSRRSPWRRGPYAHRLAVSTQRLRLNDV
jgi:hypothetical protein